jgi:hypothetical protein
MPEREYVHCRIDISIMRCATRGTCPFSYSQTSSTFRTAGGDVSTSRTRLGRVSFIDDFKHT